MKKSKFDGKRRSESQPAARFAGVLTTIPNAAARLMGEPNDRIIILRNRLQTLFA